MSIPTKDKGNSKLPDFLFEESSYTDYWDILDFLTNEEKELFFINRLLKLPS
jgi:hypothetical protein